jgi:hypothetical protein
LKNKEGGIMIGILDFNTLIVLVLIVCFMICGVKAASWMDDHFFDPDRTGTTDHWRDYWRCALWFVYLPLVVISVKRGVKYHVPTKKRKNKSRF